MDRHICRAKRKGNSQWIQGYIVKCDGNINHGRMFIIPEVTSILYTPNNITLGDFIEVQDAKVNYNNAQNTYVQTIYDYNVSRATLEKEISLQENNININTLEEKSNDRRKKDTRKNSNK